MTLRNDIVPCVHARGTLTGSTRRFPWSSSFYIALTSPLALYFYFYFKIPPLLDEPLLLPFIC